MRVICCNKKLVVNQLQKTHEQANFVAKLVKYDKFPLLSKASSLSEDPEAIKEEETS
jgi:hypothetical protein